MKTKIHHSDGTNLLITLLIRFPEVFSVRYDRKRDKIIFTFMLKISPEELNYTQLNEKFQQYLDAYTMFEQINPSFGELDWFTVDSVTFLTYNQSPLALQTSELKLLTGLLREMFQDSLCMGELALHSEELNRQEDFIQLFLNKTNTLHGEENIEVFRDGNQVFVYNK